MHAALVLGVVQFGLMYCFYIAAFRHLPAYAVALYTIFTPLYVVWLDDVTSHRWSARHSTAALLAIGGAALVSTGSFDTGAALQGVGLVQLSNLCFAAGQLGYRQLVQRAASTAMAIPAEAPPPPETPPETTPDTPVETPPVIEVGAKRREVSTEALAGLPESGREDPAEVPVAATPDPHRVPEAALLGWMYLGATLATAAAALLFADRSRLGFDQGAGLVLLYLGLVPTGLGFFLWNRGAARVGSGALAVANNLKIPLAVLCSWLIFSESADYPRVLGSLTVIVAALFVARVEPAITARKGGTIRSSGAGGASRSASPGSSRQPD